MKTLKTRILSAAMAGILAVSLAVPAFATSTTPNTQTVVTGSYEAITIDVTVPQTGTTKVNPYGLPVKLDTAGTNKIVGQQVVTMPLAITNNSDVVLTVDASVTGTPKGDLKLAAAAPTADDTAKNAFVYLQMAPNDLVKANQDSTDAAVCGFTAATINQKFAAWDPAYNADTDLVVTTKTTEKAKMVYLKGVDSSGNLVAGGSAFFRLAGSVVADPKDPWAAKDGFTVNIAFTFKPDATKVSANNGAATPAALTSISLTATSTTAKPTQDVVVTLPTGLTIESVTWKMGSDSTAKASVAAAATPANGSKAVVSYEGAGDDSVVAEVTASNGIVYTLEIPVTCVDNT